MRATYSPEDNKIRIYPDSRLDADLYMRVKNAGYTWAPKQELFVAPAWSPAREDIALELAGDIEDEDTSLVDRAEDRAERFDQYSEHRAQDAESAERSVQAIAGGIPLGQPILVGHHSERHARRDAEKIENGMRKAIKAWETSAYWLQRASGAIAAAKYKERPDVRARRIKGLEADLRKMQKNKQEAERAARFWKGEAKRKDGSPLALDRESALMFTNYYEHLYFSFPLSKYPRNPPASQYEGDMGLWSALGGADGPEYAIITPEQARDLALPCHLRTITWADRWIAHLENRLAYERAMMGEGPGLPSDNGLEVGGAIQCWASPSQKGWAYIVKVNKVSVTIHRAYPSGRLFSQLMPKDKIWGVMTKAQVEAAEKVETQGKEGFYVKGAI